MAEWAAILPSTTNGTLSKSFLICPYEISTESFQLLPENELLSNFPLAMAYLEENKPRLIAREGGKFKNRKWYAFAYPKSMILFQVPKIIVPDYNNIASFTFDEQGNFFKTGYGIVSDAVSQKYLLGLLNSRLLFSYLLSIGTSLRGGYVRFWTQFLEKLPIPSIDLSNKSDKAAHDRMVELVDRTLDLHKRLHDANTPHEKELLQRQIVATDSEIDGMVYELYGLTEEERRIVEECS